jgi:hypothetical protein
MHQDESRTSDVIASVTNRTERQATGVSPGHACAV